MIGKITIIETPRRKPRTWSKRTKPASDTKKRSQGKLGRDKRKEKSITKLIKECDAMMSRIVRYGNLDTNGLASCFTCPYKAEPKKMQNGHYLSRYYKAARWDFDNTRIQCFVCNIQKKGDSINFRARLINEIGLARVEAVEAKRTVSIKLTREYLQELLQTLTKSYTVVDY